MYSSGCTTTFDHFILFPWQANAEAYLCTCVYEQFCTLLPRLGLGRSLRKRCQRTPAPQRQAKLLIDFFIACEKKDPAARLRTQILTSDPHNFILESWTLIFFLSIFDFCHVVPKKPQIPKATSLKQIGSGRIRRQILSIYLANDLVMERQSICVIHIG